MNEKKLFPSSQMFYPPQHDLRKRVEQREEDIFKNQTSLLWEMAHQKPPYLCSENCKAPSKFYIGEPWIQMGNEFIQEGHANLVIPCKIWDGITTSSTAQKNSDEILWTFNEEPLYVKHKGRNPIISHTVSKTSQEL